MSSPHGSEHLPDCTAESLAQMNPGEKKPDHLTDHQWNNVLMVLCVDGCQHLEAVKERGRQLAAEHGW